MIVDSNLLILSSKPENVEIRVWLGNNVVSISAISRLEVLGYHKLSDSERTLIEEMLETLEIIAITDPVLDGAIRLKQTKKMSLGDGDSSIAGTAMLHGGELATRNLKDFQNIPGLNVGDPTRAAGSSGAI